MQPVIKCLHRNNTQFQVSNNNVLQVSIPPVPPNLLSVPFLGATMCSSKKLHKSKLEPAAANESDQAFTCKTCKRGLVEWYLIQLPKGLQLQVKVEPLS